MKLLRNSDRAAALRLPLVPGKWPAVLGTTALGLWACVLGGGDAAAHKAKSAPAMAMAAGQGAPVNGPGADFPVVLGEQYSIGSTVYTPADVMNYDAVGYVAVDGEGAGVSAAHHTLPIPSYIEVTSLSSGRTILVRVDRRGPMDSNRVVSLSQGAAMQLGIGDHDTVRVRRVNPPESERAVLRGGGSAPERMATPSPLLAVLTRRLGADEPVLLTGAPPPGARVSAPAPYGTPAPAPRAAVAPSPASPAPYVSPPPSAPYRPVAKAPAPQNYAPRQAAPASDLAPMPAEASPQPLPDAPPESGAPYVPSSRPYSAAPAQPARPYAPPAQPYAPTQAPPETGAQPSQAQPAQPAAEPVPFRSYLIRPLRRAPDGSVLMPGTNAPTYPTPAFPTSSRSEAVDPNGAVYAYGPPTQPGAVQPNAGQPYPGQNQAEPQRSYLIQSQSQSRAGAGMAGRTVVQPETLGRSGQRRADYQRSQITQAQNTSIENAPAHKERAKPVKLKHKKAGKADGDSKPEQKSGHRKSAPHPKPEDTSLAAPAGSAPLAALASTSGETLVVQAGAYAVRGRAEQVAQSVGGVVSLSGRVWRVRCGPFASRNAAEAALAKAKAAGYSEARIQRAD